MIGAFIMQKFIFMILAAVKFINFWGNHQVVAVFQTVLFSFSESVDLLKNRQALVHDIHLGGY